MEERVKGTYVPFFLYHNHLPHKYFYLIKRCDKRTKQVNEHFYFSGVAKHDDF